MLYFSPQIWASDNTCAISRYACARICLNFFESSLKFVLNYVECNGRMRIQYGLSLAYPPCAIGSHVSRVPNQITGDTASARSRAFVAMSGTFGFEMVNCIFCYRTWGSWWYCSVLQETNNFNHAERMMFTKAVKFFKNFMSPLIRRGDYYRLWDPFVVMLWYFAFWKRYHWANRFLLYLFISVCLVSFRFCLQSEYAAWMFVSKDKAAAVVCAFTRSSQYWSNLVPR